MMFASSVERLSVIAPTPSSSLSAVTNTVEEVPAPPASALIVPRCTSSTEFSRTVDFYVDTTAPTFTTAFDESTVNEFRQGQSGFTLTGSLVDPDVEAIRAAGIDIDQSDNLVQLFSANIMPYKAVHPATDGTVSTDITLLPSAVQSHRFLGTDAAGNIGRRVESMWFRESQPYVLGATDARVAAPGEQVTMSFTTRNADRFGQMRVEAYFNPQTFARLDGGDADSESEE